MGAPLPWWHCLGASLLWCIPEVSLQGRETWKGGAQGGLCQAATRFSGMGRAVGGLHMAWAGDFQTPHGHLISPWLVAQRMAQCWQVPLCSRDTCVVVVCEKTFPRGSFAATGTGSQVSRHGGALGSVPGWMHGQALWLLSLVALACPVAVQDGAAPWHGDVPVGCCVQEAEGPGSTQHW